MDMITIDVAKTFSRTPFGRYRTDGDDSAERFRDDILIPELGRNEDITIDFSKVALGVGSSFLEEVFGGLIRKGFEKRQLINHLVIKDKMGFYNKQVKHFIEVA